MFKQVRVLMVTAVAFGFLATPYAAMADGYPAGDNSGAVVEVPKAWAPKVEGQSAGNAGGARYHAGENSSAIVEVPAAFIKGDASAWKNSDQAGRYPAGDNSAAVVEVPKAWEPK